MAPKWWDQQGSWNQGHGQSWGHRKGQDGQGMWQCQDIDCKKVQPAKGAVWNLSHHQRCRCCNEPRAAAQLELSKEQRQKLKDAIADRKAKANGGSDASANANEPPKPPRRSKKARKAKRNKEEKDQVEAPSEEDMETNEEEPPADQASLHPVLAAEEARKKARRTWLGLPLSEGTDLRKLYPLAGPTVKGTALEIATKALAGQASEAIAVLQKKVADLHTTAGMVSRSLGEKSQPFLDVSAALEKEKKALTQLSKSTPALCSKTTEERLRKVHKDVSDDHKARLLRAQNGKEKAQERYAADQEDLDRAVQELLKRKADGAAAFLESQTSFAEYDEARRLQDAAVLAIIDGKVVQATPVGGSPAPAPGPVLTAPALPEGYSDLELQADVQLWSVPVLTEEVLAADTSAKEQIERAWAFFSNTPAGSPLPPTTYMQLGFTSMKTLPMVIGESAMRAFYARRTVVTACYMPWQVVELVRYSLSQSNQCLARDATSKEEARERLQLERDAATEHGYQRAPY